MSQGETRRLAAIMFTDIVGFSRQMGTDEARTLRLLATHNQIIQQAVAEYHGTVIKTVGDAFLVDFPSVVHAVQSAQAIQTQFKAHNTEREHAEQIYVRIGIHLGDIISFLSMIYAQKQQYDQALTEAARAITLAPNNAESYRTQGYTLILMGRPEDALRVMEQAMRLNPRYPPLYLFQLGLAYRYTGRYAEAVATLKEFLSRSPNHFPGHLGLADCYLQQWAAQQDTDPQTLEQALAAVQRAVTLNVSDPFGQANLGMVLLWQKQYEQALIQGEKAVALDSPIWAVPYTFMAETLSRMGKPEEALRMIEQALRRKSFAVDSHLSNIGAAYYLAGKPEEARALLKKFLIRYPNILPAHLILAAVYGELGKEAEARAEVAEVLRLNPQFSLEVHKQRVPIKDPAMLERHIAALRQAGLK